MARQPNALPPGPPPGGDEFEVIVVGEPTYFSPLPVVKARGRLIPIGDGEDLPDRPSPFAGHRKKRSSSPLVPTADEIATLPRPAQIAFAARCARRIKPVGDLVAPTATDAAAIILKAATIDSPLTAQLRCIRRDFNRLKRLAREQKWTDETPVPPEVFGPMWPEGVAPYWAVEPPAASDAPTEPM
jgi:hypothetical protein